MGRHPLGPDLSSTERAGWISTTWRSLAGLLLLLLASPAVVHADGFRIMDQSASAAGQSGAFTAQADDASAVYYNPAGMTQLKGVQFSVGTALIGGQTSFANSAGQTAQGNFGGSVAIPPPSNLYVTANLKDLGLNSFGNLTVGLGLLSPFGIKYRWPNNGPFSTQTTFSALPLIDIKPTLAYKVNDQLSLGLGADIYTFTSFFGQGQGVLKFNSPGGSIPAGVPLEINGSGTAPGFNASLLYTPIQNADGKPLVNIGLVYRSQAALHLDGQFLVNGGSTANTRSTFVIPQVFTGAIAVWPIRDAEREWKIEMDVDYTGWKSYRNLDTQLSSGGSIALPENYSNSFTVMFGTEHKWLELERLPDWEVALRGGYWFSQTPVPNATFDPSIPDADNHSISIGLGLLCKDNGRFLGLFQCGSTDENIFRPKAIGLDIAYQALLYEVRTVGGNNNPTVNGTYHTTFHVGTINLRVNF